MIKHDAAQALFERIEAVDSALRLGLKMARDAYKRGRADGHAAGYAEGYAQAVADWKVTAGIQANHPTHAELERRRYGPGGRESWLLPTVELDAERTAA